MIQYGKHIIEEDDIEHVNSVLKSQFLTQGPVVVHFETAVATYCGAKFAISSNSATSSLHLAMLALDISSKDLIWTSAITFVATSNAALYCGGRVDFLDIDNNNRPFYKGVLEDKLIDAYILGEAEASFKDYILNHDTWVTALSCSAVSANITVDSHTAVQPSF